MRVSYLNDVYEEHELSDRRSKNRVIMLYLVAIFFVLTGGVHFCNGEQCNEDQLYRCESAITNILENTRQAYSQRDTQEFCRNLYRKLHCLVTQTSLCLKPEERHSKSSIIHKTWRFLGSICDGYANWWRLDCYQQDGVKHCELDLSDNRNINYESCRNYQQFRECASLVVRSRCSSEDEALLGVYLLDKGRERGWLCSGNKPYYEDNGVSSSPLSAGYQKDEDCRITVRYEAQKCKKHAEERQKSATHNTDQTEEKCCIIKFFMECAGDISRRFCSNYNKELVETITQDTFGSDHEYCPETLRCSNANQITSLSLVVLVVLVLFSKLNF